MRLLKVMRREPSLAVEKSGNETTLRAVLERCQLHTRPQQVLQTRDTQRGGGRRTLVILGTGWGSYSVLRNVDKKLYDVIVISPRNHFLFTPLLASTTVGTLEFRSIIEPVRNAGFRDEHHFHLSSAAGLDLEGRKVRCVSTLGTKSPREYDVAYDVLVIGVGAVPNDFGVPGVKEHAFFLKVRCSSRWPGDWYH